LKQEDLKMRGKLLAATAAAAIASGLAPPAGATLMISASVGGVTLINCSDNAACDTNPAVGTLQLADQTVGGVRFEGSVQTSVGTPANPNPLDILNTSSLQIINTLGTTAHIEAAVGDTSFKGPVSSFDTSTSGVFQTAVGSSITTNFYDDPANGQGATSPSSTPGTQIDNFAFTATLLADSFAHSASGAVSDPALFSMTQHFVLDLVTGGELVNRGSTEIKAAQAVSEPGSLILLASGLIGLGLFARRRPLDVSSKAARKGWRMRKAMEEARRRRERPGDRPRPDGYATA
jgi:hypothetical protein